MTVNLNDYGLSERLVREAAVYEGLYLARVSEQHRDLYKVIGEGGEIQARSSGKLGHAAADPTEFPAVGDWVMVDRLEDRGGSAVIHHVLPRQSALIRQSAGRESTGQIIAANIDTIFICMSLNEDFNLRRLERYLTIAWDSGASPVAVLTKADLCTDLSEKLSEIAVVSVGVPVLTCSAQDGSGFDELRSQIKPGETVAFVGSSGVGKSTLINRLLGQERLATGDIREADGRGRHTTTHRQLLRLPDGGIVIDTPGMRELQLYTGDLSRTFEDVEEIAALCRFADCSHRTEPGCAVQEAIRSGKLSKERLDSYEKLQREAKYAELRGRQRENEKFRRMMGGKNAVKQRRKQERARGRGR